MKLQPDFGIVGYTDRWTYRPGDRVDLHLSSSSTTNATARLWRFRQLVPDGPCMELVADSVDDISVDMEVAPQQTRTGSWFEIPDNGRLATDGAFTLAFLVKPTFVAAGGNALCSQADRNAGFVLSLSKPASLCLQCRAASGHDARLYLDDCLPVGQWARVMIAFSPEAKELCLAVNHGDQTREIRAPADFSFWNADSALKFAAADPCFAGTFQSFDGRLEAPVMWSCALTPCEAFEQLSHFARSGQPPADNLVAAWDFSRAIESTTGCDIGPDGLDGRFMKLPMRAVKGSVWSGDEQNWRHAPRDYASVHFHHDHLTDAGWEVAASMRLPEDLESGCYLIEVTGSAGCDTLPIFVTPKVRGGASKLAWIAPTFTYLAYANDRCLLHGANPEVLAGRLITLTAGDCRLAEHPEYGLSLYDTHADGSGVSYASRRRPCLTFRHTQHAWQGGLGSGLWNFGADLLILSWLEREQISYEIVTDDDLDANSPDAISAYRCVITGSHPEYYTQRMHDSVQSFLHNRGRLIYLGGNGFYWRVSTHTDHPETIELRRAEDGNRSWASEPGEYYHAFDGAYGGLWRRNGRPPQALVGVGYTAQGFLKSHPYRLLPAAADARVSFLFEGLELEDGMLGDFGLIGSGAAGIEIDRADTALGTPAHALLVATSDHLDDCYILANEEVLVNRPTVFGELSPLLRADMVFFESETGGAVLSTGSIAWAGSLGDPRPTNPVARLTGNAVRRFLDPAPFEAPARENAARK